MALESSSFSGRWNLLGKREQDVRRGGSWISWKIYEKENKSPNQLCWLTTKQIYNTTITQTCSLPSLYWQSKPCPHVALQSSPLVGPKTGLFWRQASGMGGGGGSKIENFMKQKGPNQGKKKGGGWKVASFWGPKRGAKANKTINTVAFSHHIQWYPYAFICFPRFLMYYIISLANPPHIHSPHTPPPRML